MPELIVRKWDGPYSFMIFREYGVYKARRGDTGEVQFEDPSANVVLQQAINTLTSGVIYIKNGEYHDINLTINKDSIALIGESFRGVIFYRKANADAITVGSPTNVAFAVKIKNIEILGDDGRTGNALVVYGQQCRFEDLHIDGHNAAVKINYSWQSIFSRIYIGHCKYAFLNDDKTATVNFKAYAVRAFNIEHTVVYAKVMDTVVFRDLQSTTVAGAYDGLYLEHQDTGRVVFENCYFELMERYGVYINPQAADNDRVFNVEFINCEISSANAYPAVNIIGHTNSTKIQYIKFDSCHFENQIQPSHLIHIEKARDLRFTNNYYRVTGGYRLFDLYWVQWSSFIGGIVHQAGTGTPVTQIVEDSDCGYNIYEGINFKTTIPDVVSIQSTSKAFNFVGSLLANSNIESGTGAQQSIPHGCAFTPTKAQVIVSSIDDGANPYLSADPDATYIYVTAASGKLYRWEVKFHP